MNELEMYRRRQSEAQIRASERRKREDDAARLKAEVPGLKTLRLEIDEQLSGSSVSAARHVRHIVVDSAPALFELTCGEPSCSDGGHDLTFEILRSLRAGQTEFSGQSTCYGRLGTSASPCRRVLCYTATATFEPG